MKRAKGHAQLFGRIFNQGGLHTLGDHADAFVDVGNDTAVSVEKARIINHDRGLFDLAHKVERLGRGAITGLRAFYDFHQQHFVDW